MATLRIILLVFFVLPACILVERVEYTPFEEPPPLPTPSIPQLRFPANNSYQGSVHTGELRPLFQWEASTWEGPETVSYKIELSRDKLFRSSESIQSTALSYQPTRNLDVSLFDAPVGDRYYWRVSACVEEVCSDFSPTWWVNVGRVPRDLNGDGFADLVSVSEGAFSPIPAESGRVYVYGGRAGSQPINGPMQILLGSGDAWFRSAVAMGDFNADGFADLAVRVTKQDGSSPKIQIHLGKKMVFLSAVPDHIIPASECASAGDLDGDGFDDLLTSGSDIVRGTDSVSISPPIQSNIQGYASSAGDINGDGISDLLFYYDSQVSVHLGQPRALISQSPIARLRSPSSNDVFGHYSAASAGDVNGDGFSDILVGAYQDQTAGRLSGRAYLYFGGPGSSFDSEADGIFTGAMDNGLGVGVGALGDLNGDGFDDIGVRLLSVPNRSFIGGLRIHFGGPGRPDNSFETELLGEQDINIFAQRFAGGDVNGDGFNDVMVGAPGYTPPPEVGDLVGRAYIFLGAAGRVLETTPDAAITGFVNEGRFGAIAAEDSRFRI